MPSPGAERGGGRSCDRRPFPPLVTAWDSILDRHTRGMTLQPRSPGGRVLRTGASAGRAILELYGRAGVTQ